MLTWGLRPTEGAYKNGKYSGAIAGVAGGGHLWAVRWAPGTDPRQFATIQRMRVRAFTVAGYTAAQEVMLAVWKLTGYTAAHTGGNAITPIPKRAAFNAALMTGQVANSSALTPGTQTLSTDSMAAASYAELAAAATVQKGQIDILMSTEDLVEHPIILTANEGLLVRNEVAQGAGGTMRLIVELDWIESERQTATVFTSAP